MVPSHYNTLSLLTQAIFSNHISRVRLILDNHTILYADAVRLAIKAGHSKLAQILILSLMRQDNCDEGTLNTTSLSKYWFHFIVKFGEAHFIPRLLTEKNLSFSILKTLRNQIFLYEAINQKQTEIVKFLLRNGSIPEQSALYKAVKLNHTDIVFHLLHHGADANAKDNEGEYTALFIAVQYNNFGMVDLLLKYKADTDIGNARGETPLHYAVRHCSLQVVSALLNKGANINAEDNLGHTPLYEAVCSNRLPIIKLLVRYDANIDTDLIYMSMRAQKRAIVEYLLPYKKAEVLHEAVERQYFDLIRDILQYFLYYRFDVDIKDSLHHKTALYRAIYKDNLAIVSILLAYNASVNTPNPKGSSQETLLHHAARVASPEIVETLLQHGADLNIKNALGNTPLYEAMLYNRLETVQILLKYYNTVPLDFYHTVIKMGALEILKSLVEYGFSINIKDHHHSTLLHLAVQVGDCKLVEFLLCQKLDINAKDKAGNTPLYLAIQNNHQAVIHLLREKGALHHLSKHELRKAYIQSPHLLNTDTYNPLKTKLSLSRLVLFHPKKSDSLNHPPLKKSMSISALS
jgi:ankyrin repeat protein